ncbi:MAG TPA: FAD-dependent oxidoreductase, partial [Myxococcaceae bacterium]
MTTASARPLASPEAFHPGLDGFTFEDLYRPAGLKRLHERFLSDLAAADAVLAQKLEAYRAAGGKGLKPPEEAALLIGVARHVSAFIGRLFGITAEQKALSARLTQELRLFEFRREFITRRVFKKGAPDRPAAAELPALAARVDRLLQLGFPSTDDNERDVAEAVLSLLEFERLFSGQLKQEPPGLRDRWAALRQKLQPETDLLGDGDDLAQVRRLISLLDRWTFARALHPEAKRHLEKLATHVQPKPLVFDKLVELKLPDPALPEAAEGHEHHLRRRDGFKLTDRRYETRRVMAEVEYCILCHEREKDSCTRGIPAKDPAAEGNTFKKNPLGIPLTGCPLDERISEAHLLKGEGDSVAAVAMIALDNPMLPGTGHRICNDCMKSCIYQKQEPVNIPQIETSALTDVLALPHGFEIYGLLTRWNPLNVRRPHALPYLGKNVLVVGMGPAGYTLAHYLLNEGFGVAGVDGLKIEPFPDALTGKNGSPLQPIRDFSQVASELDDRVLAGFGGVSEYGITVRWDKNFLTLLHLTLARRENLRIYGGVRFGGTLTLEDAWDLGFHHVAIAAGAGRPTVIGLKNNLIRGIRKASDFLMALQLTGAFKKGALANLQVQLPAVVIGGGLTAVDTATELRAYYVVQVEKTLAQYEVLAGEMGDDKLRARHDREELTILDEFLAHGKQVRAERAAAEREERE